MISIGKLVKYKTYIPLMEFSLVNMLVNFIFAEILVQDGSDEWMSSFSEILYKCHGLSTLPKLNNLFDIILGWHVGWSSSFQRSWLVNYLYP